MAYLNEDGLETLVGKIKGQVVELTSAEYRQLPATKNTDNKLYFVNDETYSYQIDNEPTSGSANLVKSGGVYNWTSKIGSGSLTTTAQTLIPAVNELNSAVDALNKGLMHTVSLSLTTDNTGNAVLPVEYQLTAQTGKRQIVSVHSNTSLVYCSNCALTGSGYFVSCHSYNGSIYANNSVTLIVTYIQR